MLKGQITSSALIINYYCGSREGLETITSSAPTNDHCHSLKEGLETQTPSTLTNNHYCNLKEGLKTQQVTTTFILFVIEFDIPKDISFSIKLVKMGYTLWHKYCWCFRIKNLILATYSLYKYI